MKNYWTDLIAKKQAVRRINKLLQSKFLGEKIMKLDDFLNLIKDVVKKYFQEHPADLKHFSPDGRLNYRFHLEHHNGYVTRVEFEV